MTSTYFVALPVIIDVDVLVDILDGAPSGLDFTPAEELHVTIAFLGPIDPDRALEAIARLDLLGESSGTLEHIVWLGPEEDPRAMTMKDPSDSALREFIETARATLIEATGARPDRYGVAPHVTIAWIPRDAAPELREAAVGWAHALDNSGIQVPYSLARPQIYTHAAPGSDRRYEVITKSTPK